MCMYRHIDSCTSFSIIFVFLFGCLLMIAGTKRRDGYQGMEIPGQLLEHINKQRPFINLILNKEVGIYIRVTLGVHLRE